MNRDQFHKKIDSFNDELINLRRHIHAHPELSGLENQTAILISGFLKKIGWNVKESIGRTGVIADFGPLDKGIIGCLLYTSPSPRDMRRSRMPSSA